MPGADGILERVREPPLLGAVERVLHEPPQLPRVDIRLARRRIHRDEGSRLLTFLPEDVDDRVDHLAAAAVALDATEERRLGPEDELLLAPRLVEEGESEVRGAVEHLHFDDRSAAVASTAPSPS